MSSHFVQRTKSGLERYVPDTSYPWNYTRAAHLLRRCMIGVQDQEIRRAVDEGLEVTIERLFTRFKPSVSLIEDFAGKDPEFISPPEGDDYTVWFWEKLERRDRLGKWWLKVLSESPVSLQEVMTIFWHSHFTTSVAAAEFAEWVYGQNVLLRNNVFGNFRSLVEDITTDMAMLMYLDGVRNFKSWDVNEINENYARELMEIYTMGVTDWDGNVNYTQKDVVEAARALSGWFFSESSVSELHRGLASSFQQHRWDDGVKTFMGEQGNFKASHIIDILFRKRGDQIAKFLCEKLYRTLVYDAPDRKIVEGMAATLRGNDWNIEPVLRQLLMSWHFFDDVNIGGMIKGQIRFHLDLIRGMALKNIPDFDPQTRTPYNDLLQRMQAIGHMLFSPPTVKGWTVGRSWITSSTLPLRLKFAYDIAAERIPLNKDLPHGPFIHTFDPIEFARTFPTPEDPRSLCEDMTRYFLSVPPTEAEIDTLLEALLDGGVEYEWSLTDPEQQAGKRIRKLLRAIFQHPAHQLY